MKPIFKPGKWAADGNDDTMEFRSVKNKPAFKKTANKEKAKKTKVKKNIEKVTPEVQNLNTALESMESKCFEVKYNVKRFIKQYF